MIRKRYLGSNAGLLTLAVVAAGCGKKNAGRFCSTDNTNSDTKKLQYPATPTPEMVNMEETVEKNIMGEKTSTASKVTIVNQTGSEDGSVSISERLRQMMQMKTPQMSGVMIW